MSGDPWRRAWNAIEPSSTLSAIRYPLISRHSMRRPEGGDELGEAAGGARAGARVLVPQRACDVREQLELGAIVLGRREHEEDDGGAGVVAEAHALGREPGGDHRRLQARQPRMR